MKKGMFIVFEGGEGSGKTHHRDLTAEYLREKRQNVIVTHEPGGTSLGQHIREVLLSSHEKITVKTELFLFLADRAQHMEEMILPELQSGKIVLCDRFSGSMFAYQIGARGLMDEGLIKQMDAYSRSDIKPDHVIYLDVSPKVGVGRKQNQSGHSMNRFDSETMDFHNSVRNYFQKLAKEESWHVFNADRSMETVQNEINMFIDQLI